MDKKLFDTKLAIEKHSKKFFFTLAAVMLMSNLMLAFFVVTADTTEKTVIVPVGFDKPFYVKGNVIDPVYGEQIARYISGLRWSYTPKTVESNLNDILGYVTPSQYSLLESRFNQEAVEVVRNQVSSVFNPMKVRVDMNNNEIVIQGEYVAYMGTQLVSKRERFLKMKVIYQDGGFALHSMREVSGTTFNDLQEIKADDFSPIENKNIQLENEVRGTVTGDVAFGSGALNDQMGSVPAVLPESEFEGGDS